MFYWIRSLQTYSDGWDYIGNLKKFVQGGMKDGAFIDAVSGIVNRVSSRLSQSFTSIHTLMLSIY
jgi:hypothetical protein